MSDEITALKAATHAAIKAAGGFENAENVTGYSKSSLHNAQSLDQTCTIPTGHALALEQFVGSPYITRAMARMQGYELHPIAGQRPTVESLDDLLLRTTKELGEAVAAVQGKDRFESMACFHVAEKEVTDLLRVAQTLVDEVRRRDPRKLAELREAG